MASAGALRYKVLLGLRGMPAHIAGLDAAERILASSCADLVEAPQMADREDLREFFVAAWCRASTQDSSRSRRSSWCLSRSSHSSSSRPCTYGSTRSSAPSFRRCGTWCVSVSLSLKTGQRRRRPTTTNRRGTATTVRTRTGLTGVTEAARGRGRARTVSAAAATTRTPAALRTHSWGPGGAQRFGRRRLSSSGRFLPRCAPRPVFGLLGHTC